MGKTSRSANGAARPVGIAYLIGRLDHALSRGMRDALASLGLTVSQYTALSFLARGSLSNAQLAERSLVSPQAANEMVKAMEARGWLAREPDPSHGRIVRINLTAEGADLLAQGDAEVARLEAGMLGELPEAERRALRETLRGLLRGLAADSVLISGA